MINVALVDDHPLLLNGICNVLQAEDDMFITGSYLTGTALLDALKHQPVDVLLLDLYLASDPQGKELVKLIRRSFPRVRILVLTSNDNALNMRMALNAGAHGYLLKNVEQELLAEAVRTVYQNQEYLSPEVKNILLQTVWKTGSGGTGTEKLTKRESEVLKLIAEEKTSHEIGALLHLSYRTVETYRIGIMQKLGAKNMVGMVKKAITLGLIQ